MSSLSLYNFTAQGLENTYKACLCKYEEKYYSGKGFSKENSLDKEFSLESEDYVIKGSKIDKYFIPQVGSKGQEKGFGMFI